MSSRVRCSLNRASYFSDFLKIKSSSRSNRRRSLVVIYLHPSVSDEHVKLLLQWTQKTWVIECSDEWWYLCCQQRNWTVVVGFEQFRQSVLAGPVVIYKNVCCVPVIRLIFLSSEPAKPATWAPKLNPIRWTSSNLKSICCAKPEIVIKLWYGRYFVSSPQLPNY